MSMHQSRSFVIICCLILILGILAYAFITDTNTEVLSKEEIQTNIQAQEGKDLGYKYISSYLKKYGIGNINEYKLNIIEEQLETDFYQELPTEYDMAKTICELYLEYFYEDTDVNDKVAVTDAVLHCLFAALGDPYAYYRPAKEFDDYITSLGGTDSFVGIGVMLDAKTLEVIMVYKDSGAEQAGIRHGDFIYGVEGKTVEDTSTDELMNMLKGEIGTTVNITVKRGDDLIDVVATRLQLNQRSVTYEIDDNNIGYIYVSQFLGTTDTQFREAVDFCTENGAVALVIDMRYNPGGLVSAQANMVDYLVPDSEDRIITSYEQSGTNYVYKTSDGHHVDIPIAVICNGGTASAAELFTAALRDFSDMGIIDAVTVGTTTYGKGVIQTSYEIYDGSGLTYTIGYCNPPSGVNYHGVGIIPDVPADENQGANPIEIAKNEVLKLVNKNSGVMEIYDAAA